MSLPLILTASAALENADAALTALGITAFDKPPEVIMQSLPCAVRFKEPSPQRHGSRLLGRYNIYNFKIEVHFPRGVLWEAVGALDTVAEAYQNLYTANLYISGTCDVSGFRDPADSGIIEVRYGSDQPITIAIIFYMWAKEMLDDITVSLEPGIPP